MMGKQYHNIILNSFCSHQCLIARQVCSLALEISEDSSLTIEKVPQRSEKTSRYDPLPTLFRMSTARQIHGEFMMNLARTITRLEKQNATLKSLVTKLRMKVQHENVHVKTETC